MLYNVGYFITTVLPVSALPIVGGQNLQSLKTKQAKVVALQNNAKGERTRTMMLLFNRVPAELLPTVYLQSLKEEHSRQVMKVMSMNDGYTVEIKRTIVPKNGKSKVRIVAQVECAKAGIKAHTQLDALENIISNSFIPHAKEAVEALAFEETNRRTICLLMLLRKEAARKSRAC